MKKNNFLSKNINWIIVLIFSILIIFFSYIFQDKLSQFKTLGLIGIFLANLIGSATIFLPAPAIVTVVAGGIIYSPFLVALIATLGATLGDMLGFLLGISGKKLFLKKEYAFYNTLKYFMKKFGGITIFIFAFLPNPVFDAISIVAGATGYSVFKFILWIFLGRLARNILLAYFGAKF